MIHLSSDEPAPTAPVEKFSMGRVVATPALLAAVPDTEIQAALRRHLAGDWGELCEDDRAANEIALRDGLRLFSIYRSNAGTRFYVITEHDRSVTTVLLPEDY